MTIKSISYQKAFVIGPYLQERIGVEIELSDTDDPDKAFQLAQEMTNDFHKKANPHLEGTTITDVPVQAVFSIGEETQSKIDQEFAKAHDDLSKIEFQEDAITYLNNNGWTFNIELKKIANSKPKKQ